MIPRRSLLVLTAAVLALHALALVGLPLRWHHPITPAAQVFNTRTLAAPSPPPAAPPAAPPRQATPAHPRPAPVRRAPVRPKPSAVAAPAAASENTAPPPTDVALLLPPDSAPALKDAPTLEDVPVSSANASAPGEPAPQEPPPPAPALPDTASVSANVPGAIDIVLPGAAPGASSHAAPPVRLPAPLRLQFDVSGEVKKFHYSARAELLWQHDSQHYQARQEISLLFLGSRTQTSVGDLAASGLLPQRFGDRARNEQAAHFDYAQGRVTFSANTPEAPLVAGTQDRLSVFIQLGALLAAAPERYPPGTQISIATVSARAFDVWSFTIEGEETLPLPAGAMPTLKLQRVPRRDHDYDQKAELWLAPALGYLPARIRLTQANGDFADLQLRSYAAP